MCQRSKRLTPTLTLGATASAQGPLGPVPRVCDGGGAPA